MEIMPLTWPENSDLAEEFFRTVVFLDTAIKLHRAALAPKSKERSQELRELVSCYYEQLCSAVCAHSDSRESLHKQLVSRAGGVRNSPLSRNHRYALNLNPILWSPNHPPLIVFNGVLDDKDLKRALRNLDHKDVLARLRSISIPDFDQEHEEMETEVCAVDHWRRDIECAAERGAEAVMERTRQSDERSIGQVSDATERESSGQPVGRRSSHSDDFRSVDWYGTLYEFTANQAACIKVLWEHWERGTPTIGDQTVLETADIAQTRLDQVFRDRNAPHLAWGKMIVPGPKGTHRLLEPSR